MRFSIDTDSDEVQTHVTRASIGDGEQVRAPRPTLDEIDEAIDSLRCAQRKQRTGKC